MSAVRVRVPASSANLGPGFDVLAAALGRVSVRSVRDVEYVDNTVAPVQPQPMYADSDAVTEIQPAAGDTGRHHRSGWRETLSRKRTPAH